MELPGVDAPRAKLAALLLVLVLAAILVAGGLAGTARAANRTVTTTTTTTVADPNTPVLVTDRNTPPKGYTLTAAKVERIAAASLAVKAELRRHPGAVAYEYTKGPGQWQVSWFSSGKHQVELAQVYVDDASGAVTQVWTGFQVAWSMARGYPGAFGRRVNAWYVWIPMCLLFMAPFIPWRRTRVLADGRRRRAWSMLHLDLLALLGLSVSLAFFNHGTIGLSTPLLYPFMLYLMVRMLALGFGRGRPREPLRLGVPVAWVSIGVVFLVGFRIGLNVVNSNVIDVGYAGVIGADKLVHGKPLYGGWPKDNANGDTYGPVAYYAYVPFRAIFGWSGTWDDLPAAHAAAIVFDLLTLFGLFWLGRRVRGPTLGVVLAYAWAAYPFTLWTLSSNTNDALVSLLIVVALLAITSPAGRGVAAALAGLTKFAPLGLGPLLLRGVDPPPSRRAVVRYVVVYALTTVIVMLPVLLDDNLRAFWHDTIAYQASRTSPFSIWGLYGGLGVEQHLFQGATAALALGVMVIPERRGLIEVAALAAAVIIALQLAASYWLYSYIVWFYAPLVVALFGSFPSEIEYAVAAAVDARSAESAPVAVSAAAP
ncbi:MAG TPA: hypothetical protein VJ741_03665 [Solirubrobacteraceae bacterium]|nr:hypothetical protein [Solirubrobacteraceae bacterium]